MKKLMTSASGWMLAAVLILPLAGCGDTASEAEKAAGEAAKAAGDMAKETGEAATEMAEAAGEKMAELSDKAKEFLSPLGEQFSGMKDMVSEPEKLKQAASDMITKIEEQMGNIELPEAVTNTLNAAKEKLIELRDYITEEADEAGITEKVNAVMESVKGGLGLDN